MSTIWTVEGMMSENRTEILPEVLPESSAYIIMTSGTTGIPKGAEISHKGAWNTIEDVNKRAMIGSENVFLGVSALDFDLSVYDIFGTLGIGGTLIMISDENSRNAEYWLKNGRGISSYYLEFCTYFTKYVINMYRSTR